MRLKRDASLFYEASESTRSFIVSQLEKKNFNFSRFYRWELQEGINSILEKNEDIFLPDFDSYYLLMHLSLENVLKGVWLDKFPEQIGFDKLPNILRTHDLPRLASDISLSLSAQQNRLLSKLVDIFLGYGRYPIKDRVRKPASPHDWDFGERSFDAVCIDCITNPYAVDKKVIDKLFEENLQMAIEAVFENSHERMLSTFDFPEQQGSNQNSDNEDP